MLTFVTHNSSRNYEIKVHSMFKTKNSHALVVASAFLISVPLTARAADPTAKELPVPSSILKMTPTGSVSILYVALNYGVSGGKIFVHEFKKGTGPDEIRYVDIITPNGKRIQRFQLAYPAETMEARYQIRPQWIVPSRKKLAALLFEGTENHLMIVFAKGFGQPGSQQFFAEKVDGDKREISFNELDRRGYRMVRLDINVPTTDEKPAYKATSYFFWNGSKFTEKPH